MAQDLDGNKRQKTCVTIPAESIKWISCRGGLSGDQIGFREAVISGWAKDGGMLLPSEIPTIPPEELESWRSLSYPDLCTAVLRKWIPSTEISDDDLRGLVKSAFDRFGIDSVLDLKPLKTSHPDTTYQVLELFHGPTLAFKDLGMSVLCEILQYFLKQNKSHLTLLVGTSGDTGPSALEAVRGMEDHIDCVVLYPRGRVSRVQEGQMMQCNETMSNATVICVDGTSDELDVPCEQVLKDNTFKETHSLGTVNSVNIVRMLVQTVHYFYGYLHIPHADCDRLNFSVPSGAAGHMVAGVLARKMGLPFHRLLVATNDNDVLHVMISTGVLRRSNKGAAHTLSNAMDIQVPYNYERLLFLCCHDPVRVSEYVKAVNKGETVELPSELWKTEFAGCGLVSCAVGEGESDPEVLRTIKAVYELSGYLVDPHTAVGISAAMSTFPSLAQPIGKDHVVCMGCAHPVKFAETVSTALGLSLEDAAQALSDREPQHPHVKAALSLLQSTTTSATEREGTRFSVGEQWTEKLKQIIQSISDKRRESKITY